jgi:uncharacterized protein YfbU (UPF0304 family)
MKLSNGEKLILVMLTEVYEKLGVKGEIDPEFVKAAIVSGQTWGLRRKYEAIFEISKDDENPRVVNEVTSILTMWRAIESTYNRLSFDEREQLKREAGYFEDDICFYGFDEHQEAEYLSAARFLIIYLGLFDEFKYRVVGAGSETVPRYRKMLAAYELLMGTLRGRSFNASELLSILKAGR